ncbi:MAG: SDR family oxidoreductase [Chloroflexota bacterium]
MQLADKVALVTGGAHRVGKAITMMLAAHGVHVIINYNSSAQAAMQTKQEAESHNIEAMAVQCDVSDLASVQSMVDAIESHFGGVDILVNAASLFGRFKVPTSNEKHLDLWHKVTGISINGTFYLTNLLAPRMTERAKESGESGAIVNIVDLSIWQPWPSFTAHAVGKSGILTLTQQFALELAPHIRANAVAPGMVLPPPDTSDERNEALAKRNLLKRWGIPKDVANTVKFLVESNFITGEVIKVDGGEHIASQ